MPKHTTADGGLGEGPARKISIDLLSPALVKLLAAAGVGKETLEAWLAAFAEKHPEISSEQAVAEFRVELSQKLNNALNPLILAALVDSTLEEIKSRRPGYNPDHPGVM
jgi:hypothetical protein